MKTTIKLRMCVTIAMLFLSYNWAFAQFQPYNAGPFQAGRTLPNIGAIAIGNFPNFTSPLAALHINTNLLPANNVFTPGEVFRTDCPIGQTTSWRLFRGGTQRGRLFNLTTDNHFTVEASSGNMIFNTSAAVGGTARERVRILNGTGHTGLTDVTKVNISYGGGFLPVTVPVAMLNLGFNAKISPQGGQQNNG